MVLPLVEQVAELVGGGAPVGVVAQGGRQSFGLLDDGGALGDGLGLSSLARFGDLGLLGLAGGLQFHVTGLEGREVAHHRRFGGFFAQQLHGLVDFTGLDVGGGQARGQQIELGLEIQEATGVQCQRLLLGGVRELSDLTFAVAVLDEDGAVVIDPAESFGGFDVGLGIGGGGGRGGGGMLLDRGSLLGEGGGGGRVRFRHGSGGRSRRRRGRAGLGCGCRCLLFGRSGVYGFGDSFVGHGQLLKA